MAINNKTTNTYLVFAGSNPIYLYPGFNIVAEHIQKMLANNSELRYLIPDYLEFSFIAKEIKSDEQGMEFIDNAGEKIPVSTQGRFITLPDEDDDDMDTEYLKEDIGYGAIALPQKLSLKILKKAGISTEEATKILANQPDTGYKNLGEIDTVPENLSSLSKVINPET